MMSASGGVQDVTETDVGDGVNNGAQIEAGCGHLLEFGDDATVELGTDPGRDHARVESEGVGALALEQGSDGSGGGTGEFTGSWCGRSGVGSG